MSEQDAAKEQYEALDALVTAQIELDELLSNDEERQKALYWEARKQGLPFPVEYNPQVGAVLDRLLVVGMLNWEALREFFFSVRHSVPRFVSGASEAIHQIEVAAEARAPAKATRRPVRNRRERRAARTAMRRRVR